MMTEFTVGELILTMAIWYMISTAMMHDPDDRENRELRMKVSRWFYRNRMGGFLLRCVVSMPLIIITLWLVQTVLAAYFYGG